MCRERFVLAALLAANLAGIATGQVVISQVDGNGGLTTGAADPWDRDFVELFNRGSTPVNLTGGRCTLGRYRQRGNRGNTKLGCDPALGHDSAGAVFPGCTFLPARLSWFGGRHLASARARRHGARL